MSGLRLAAALLLTAGGFCAGDARRQRLAARRRALEEVIGLLTRLRQEIGYRRADLGPLCRTLAAEYGPDSALGRALAGADGFARLAPPAPLEKGEAACFTECFAGLGRSDAGQECARLDYYLARFETFLAGAREEEARSASLDRRLGLAAGAVLGLLIL